MAVIEQRNTVRIPQNQRAAIHRLHRLRDELEQKTAHNVRFEVAAEASDMKLDVATDVMRTERTHSLGDTIPNPDAPTDSTFAEGRLQDLLNVYLGHRGPPSRDTGRDRRG